MKEAPVASKPPIAFAEECDRGIVREENQDSVLHAPIAMGELLIVADGIGGYQGGATASRMVVDGFYRYLAALPPDCPVDRALCEASAQVNAGIIQAASQPDSPFRRMGSTVVLALLQQDATGFHARIGHIGDSRAYLFRDGQLSRITSDHSAVQALINRNLITPEQALNHPDASVLTRSLGHKSEVQMDLENVDLLPGDTLLLCSDGLWGYVAEEAIQRVVADPSLNAGGAAHALLDLALAAGGHDNIGIEMARLKPPSNAALAAPKPPRRKGFMEFFALGLLAVAALGALAYFTVKNPWFKNLLHSRVPAQTAQADAPSPTSPLTYAIVGPDADESKLYPVPGWSPADLPGDKQYACRELAAQAKEIVIYFKDQAQAGPFIARNQSFFKDLKVPNMRERDNQIETTCGDLDLVVFVPGVKPAVASKPAVQPRPAVKPGTQVQPKPPVPAGPEVQPKPGEQPKPAEQAKPTEPSKPPATPEKPTANEPKPPPGTTPAPAPAQDKTPK